MNYLVASHKTNKLYAYLFLIDTIKFPGRLINYLKQRKTQLNTTNFVETTLQSAISIKSYV